MTTSAGLYVKEFVHGDRGRAVPSLGSMLKCQADIMQLDVLDVGYVAETDEQHKQRMLLEATDGADRAGEDSDGGD